MWNSTLFNVDLVLQISLISFDKFNSISAE